MLVVVLAVLMVSLVVTAQESNREIVINVPAFTLYLYENGIPLRSYPIGVGNEVKPSVLGKTKVINRVVDPTYYPSRWWERGIEPIPPGPDNPVGTRWIGLGFPSYGIHGTNNPDSIGKAMSSGCIRMYNHDVEELMGLISVDTPVTFLYETILLSQDPLLGTKMITIHPDIYQRGINTLDHVDVLLDNRNWTDVHLPVIESMLNTKAKVTHPLPLKTDFQFNDDLVVDGTIRYGLKYYVPVDLLDLELVPDLNWDQQDWDTKYINLIEYANTTGYGYEIQDAVRLFTVDVMLSQESIDVQGFMYENDLYLPVNELSNSLGLPFNEQLVDYVTIINNKPYISHGLTNKWGFNVEWKFPQQAAYLMIPQVYLDGELLGIALYGEDNEILVPLSPIEGLIKADMRFNANEEVLFFYDTHGVQAKQIGDLIYVPEWVIRWMMPGAELHIVYPE